MKKTIIILSALALAACGQNEAPDSYMSKASGSGVEFSLADERCVFFYRADGQGRSADLPSISRFYGGGNGGIL